MIIKIDVKSSEKYFSDMLRLLSNIPSCNILHQTISTSSMGIKKESCIEENLVAEEKTGQHDFVAQDKIRARSVLKHLNVYVPPEDLQNRLENAVKKYCPSWNENWKEFSLEDAKMKFQILNHLEISLGKLILNSCLHELKTMEDVLNYFLKPVSITSDYSKMARSSQLPKNVHILEDAVRFHPLTDEQHGGITAFPKSSTYVPSLRFRRYVKGFRAKTEWHHFEEKHFDYTSTPPEAPWLKKKSERMDNIRVNKLCYF
ncbi:39S ribosomal protein L50, mitochondrial [Trichinella murrelli]|uniref:Large ribosomal subunit protein mL50 n=1 Tax=Trichinella murrelli TaxID=144512 RepID=A0A0V0T621_9BILA|nr:39S ribosomal protein L50, mitochondrial [Trichinella murrelli]